MKLYMSVYLHIEFANTPQIKSLWNIKVKLTAITDL